MNPSSVSTADSYKIYKDTSINPISKSDYLKIVNGFFKFLMELIFDGEHVKLPSRTGSVYIVGKKQRPKIVDGEITGLAPDWVKTKELWERNPEAKAKKTRIFHLNEHTNGLRYKIKWSKALMYCENKTLYALRFTWGNKRSTNKLVVAGKEYITENH